MKPVLAAYNPKMYNYTKNIYKAVKCTLKTQIKGFCRYCTNRKTTITDHKLPKAIIVYYLCGAVVYGCTTPLIHLTEGYGCLLEKFFYFLFLEISKVAYSFPKNFF